MHHGERARALPPSCAPPWCFSLCRQLCVVSAEARGLCSFVLPGSTNIRPLGHLVGPVRHGGLASTCIARCCAVESRPYFFVPELTRRRYSGASAARVWGSIYWENLRGFQHSKCMEKRILFRLLSGLHSSIMTQIANEYRFDGELAGGRLRISRMMVVLRSSMGSLKFSRGGKADRSQVSQDCLTSMAGMETHANIVLYYSASVTSPKGRMWGGFACLSWELLTSAAEGCGRWMPWWTSWSGAREFVPPRP